MGLVGVSTYDLLRAQRYVDPPRPLRLNFGLREHLAEFDCAFDPTPPKWLLAGLALAWPARKYPLERRYLLIGWLAAKLIGQLRCLTPTR